MANLIKTLRKPIFTDADGNRWKYYTYERDTYALTAIYQSVENPETFIDIDVDFEYQEGESISGWEYPEHHGYRIEPGESGYDYGLAVTEALDCAHAIVRERRAA